MPKVEVTTEYVTVTDKGNQSEYEILEDLSERPRNVRFTSIVLDSDGCEWTTAWVQVLPGTLEAFAWLTYQPRHLHQAAAEHGPNGTGGGNVA